MKTIAEREYDKWQKDVSYDPTEKAIACQVISPREYYLYADNSGMEFILGQPSSYCPMKDFYYPS